jgi:uncharacterized protein involved in outer membrane biogenesis
MKRWLLAGALAAALLPVVAALALVAFGVTIDGARWRDELAARASSALGRAVAIDGAIALTLGRTTRLRIGGVRIGNPLGFSGAAFATVGEAHASVDLAGLLRGRLVLRELGASDIAVRLERSLEGRTNWTFPQRAEPEGGGPAGSSRVAIASELQQTTLHRLNVEYHDARSGGRQTVDLDELTAIGRWDDPLRLILRGRVARSFPYLVTIEGGPARLLASADARWPFTLDFEFLGTRLHAAGAYGTREREARFRFGAGTENLEQVERFLETALPKFGHAALSGEVVAAPHAVRFGDLRGVLGAAEVTGELKLAFGAGRPRLAGELAMAELDLRPFLRDAAREAGRPLTYDELANDTLPLRDLVPIDLALSLRVDRWHGLAGDVRAAALELEADARGIRAPLAITIADVPLTGRIALDTAAATPSLTVELAARRAPLGNLAALLTGLGGVDGTLERFAVRAGGQGETLGAVVRDLGVRLELARARLSYGNVEGARPVAFTLDTLEVVARPGERLWGTARGTLLGEPATLAVRTAELPRLLRGGVSPLEADLRGAAATVRVEGTFTRTGAARGVDLAFRLDARRSGDLARWLGVAPESSLPIALRGRGRMGGDEWHIDETTLTLGRSEITVDAHRTSVNGRPVLVAAVRSPLIDLPELQSLRVNRDAAASRGGDASIDVPILPYGIDLADADIGLGLERVRLGRVDLVDLGFGARVREGHLPPSPFAARLAGVPFEGLFALDLRGEVPEASLAMSTGAVDVGALLGTLEVARDVDAQADALQVELVGRGSRLSELIGRSSFQARLLGGQVVVRGPAAEPLARIRLTEASIGAQPGERVTALLEGTLDETPVTIQVRSGTLSDFAQDANRVPFDAEARAAGARLRLDGEAALPLGSGGQLTLDLSGDRLDSLSGLARVALPPWGPWTLRGPIAMTATGYAVERLALQVGASRLEGRGTLDVTGARPRLDLRVTAPHLQLDDFPRPARDEPAAPAPTTAESLRATARDAASQTQSVLGAGFLRRFDAYVDVSVGQVVSGADRLGDGTLRIQLIDGRLYLGPAEVNLPGGTARLSIAYDAHDGGVRLAAGAYVENFDYGIVARRRRAGSDLAGLFSMDMALVGEAPSLDAIMASANGHIDLAVWPKDFGAGAIDLWVVNLFRELLPVLERGQESRVNCAVGRFDLSDGRLTRDALVLDTSRMRVRGAGTIDFRTEAIDLHFRPRAKGLQLFSLETPVRVTGTLTDFHIVVSPGDVLATIARFLASVIVVPLENLFRGPLPRDGADVCTDPLRVLEQTRR